MLALFLLGLVLGTDAQAAYTCSTWQTIAAPYTLVVDPYTTGTQCWKFTSVDTYQFLNYSIPSGYQSYDYFYFYSSDSDARYSGYYDWYTRGQAYTIATLPTRTAFYGTIWVYFYSSSGLGGYWSLQVNAINPAGGACTIDPPLQTPPTSYLPLEKGTCAPSGGTPSGSSCQLGCSSPKMLYTTNTTTSPSITTYPYYSLTEIYCKNGNWMPLKYPAFCYSLSSCSGDLASSTADEGTYDTSACKGKTFSGGDTCTITCQPTYVAYESYLPTFLECRSAKFGYPSIQHTGWSFGQASSYCRAPCTSLPSEATQTGFTAGNCRAGSDVKPGTTCTLGCTGGYVQTGSLLFTCIDDYWSSEGGNCQAPCQNQPTVFTGFQSPAGCSVPAQSGTSCVLKCADTYLASGDMTATCVDGQWYQQTGDCLAPCTTTPTNPVNGSYSGSTCAGTQRTGTQCPLTCTNNAVSTKGYSTCLDGGWETISCDVYYWYNYSWSTCASPTASCVAGVSSSNGGTQTRTVECRNANTNVKATDRFCVNAGPKLATTQDCAIPCPQTPTINNVVPYDGAAEITFTVYDPSASVTSPTIFISYCVAKKSGGQCEFDDKSPLFVSLYKPIPIGAVYGAYDQINGRRITLVYYNLTNGVSYSFRAVYEYASGNRYLQSQYSVGSPAVTAGGSCYGGCVNGNCVRGVCSCKPGPLYANQGNCSITPSLTTPTFPFSPYNISLYGQVSVSWTTNLPAVHVFVLPEMCRNSKECVPKSASRFVTGSGTSIYVYENPGTYFVRLFWTSQMVADSESFQILDPLCNGVVCNNGGKCLNGKCQCTSDWKNATCNVPRDSCDKKGVDCGIWGTCNGNGGCDCVKDWSGDQCQYPPKCGIRCGDHGFPNDPLLTLQPGNTWGCTYCKCDYGWQGDRCDQCAIKCFNGGSPSSGCGSCTCPTWWTGSDCQSRYWIASFQVNLNPPNLDLTKSSDRYYFEYMVQQDIIESLELTTSATIQVKSIGNTVTVWIVGGASSPFIRANLERQISGQAYGLSTINLQYQSTLTGEKVVASTYAEKDPPSAGWLTTPSVFVTLCLILLGLMMKH